MPAPNWNPCLSAAQNFFGGNAGCGCCSYRGVLQTRSASMRLGPLGHSAFNFLNDNAYRRLVSSTQFTSSRSPLNGPGNWHGSEQVTAVYDQWGNITYSGQRTRSWSEQSVHFLWKGVLLFSGQYSESATIDEHGCLQGTYQLNGIQWPGIPYSDTGPVEGQQTVASRCDAYDCPAGVGCGFPTVNITATQWTENWSCTNSPNARPGSYTHSRTLSEQVTANDIIATIDAALPAIESVPWGGDVLGVIRRIGYTNSCEDTLGDTFTDLQNELDALQQAASDASDYVADCQQSLSDAQTALDDYVSGWQADHLVWKLEKVARCEGEGINMDDAAFGELEGRVFARATQIDYLNSVVCTRKQILADAEAVQAVADYFVTLKQNAIAAVNQRWQPMLEAGSIAPDGVFDQMPVWIDKGHAQARVKVELDYPAQGLGETFRCTCGGQSFDITVPAGECIAYGPPFTFTSDTPYGVEIENITAPPL